MQQDGSKSDALIYIQISSIGYKSNLKQANITLKLYLRRNKQSNNNRISIAQKQLRMNQQKCSINEVCVALCRKEDYLQIQFAQPQSKTNAYLRFPLDKLVEMPRVKHQIECKLIEKNWDRFFQGPLRNIVDMDMAIIAYDHIVGKFIISSIQIHLTRNTELVGEMDPYVQLKLQGQTKQTVVRQNQGKNCVWNEKIEFQLGNINKGLILTLNVMDKDNLSSDLVGSKSINLVQESMLLPLQEVRSKTFTLIYNNQSAGIIKIDYQFHPMPFNF